MEGSTDVDGLIGRKQSEKAMKGASSGWLLVSGHVPQASMLRLLCTSYVIELDDGGGGLFVRFANDTKLHGGVGNFKQASVC